MATVTNDLTMTHVGHEVNVTVDTMIVQHQTKGWDQWFPKNLRKHRYALWTPCCSRSAIEGPHRYNRDDTMTVTCNRCGNLWTWLGAQVEGHGVTATVGYSGRTDNGKDYEPLREMDGVVYYLFVPSDVAAPKSYSFTAQRQVPLPAYEAPKAIPDLSGDAMAEMAAGFDEPTVGFTDGAEIVADDLPEPISDADGIRKNLTWDEIKVISKAFGIALNQKKDKLIAQIVAQVTPKSLSDWLDSL